MGKHYKSNYRKSGNLKVIYFTFLFCFLLFGFQGNSQQILTPDNNIDCTTDPDGGNCSSSNVKILGAYIGDANGNVVNDNNVGTYSDTDLFYVYVKVDASGQGKYDLYAQFYLIDLSEGGSTSFVKAFTPGLIVTGDYKIDYPIENYVSNGQVNLVIGLEDILISWDNKNDNTPTCPTGNYSTCNGGIPDIVAEGPFKVYSKYDPILCNGDTTDVTIGVSGGTTPYNYTIDSNNTGGTATWTSPTLIFNGASSGTISVTLTDSNSHSETITVNLTEPTELVNTTDPSSGNLDCASSTTDASFTASGGTAPYTYTIDNNTTGGTASWTAPTLTFTGASNGTITVTFTDANGCSATNSIAFNYSDNSPPTITCPTAVTANTSDDGTGNCTTSVDLGTPLTNDNCGVKSVTASVDGGIIDPTTYLFSTGSTDVTWTVTDNSDNIATCVQTVTVVDNEHPGFNAPANIVLECDQDTSDLSITGNPNIYGDNCDPNPVVTYSDAITEGICANSYTITRTWRVTDVSGNYHDHNQIIFVEDTTDPTASNPAPITVQCADDVPAPD
ncbi:HYR domain-containing protein, partial [Gaetbulibacter aestuarii]